MQGHVTDEKGAYVKAAIVRLYKKSGDAGCQDPAGEAEAVTYVETDEEGRFLIQDLDPEEKYFIEIHIGQSEAGPAPVGQSEAGPAPVQDEEEPGAVSDELECDEEDRIDEDDRFDEDDRIEDINIVDSLAAKTPTGSMVKETVCINCCCNYKNTVDQKAKPYLTKTNLW